MYDYRPELVQALSQFGYPVEWENQVDSTTKPPMITYAIQNNTSIAEGGKDSLRYSLTKCRIKAWCTDLRLAASLCQMIDEALLAIGFKRINYNELFWTGGQVCCIIDYEARTVERN